MSEALIQSIGKSCDRIADSILPAYNSLQRYCEAHPVIALAVLASGCVFAVARDWRSALD